MKVATWNVQSLYRPGQARRVIEEARRYCIDVLALQEVRWPGSGESSVEGDTILYSGRQDEQHRQGVGVYLSKRVREALMSVDFINERLMRIRLNTKWCKTSIVVAYAPTEVAAEEDKDVFYDELRDAHDRSPRHDINLILGDFNAKVGRETDPFSGAIGAHSLHEECNDNGMRLATFALGNSMVIGGTLFQHRNIHKETWMSPDGVTRNQIDHILISKKHRTTLKDVKTRRGADCGSDHHMVTATLKMKLRANRPRERRVVRKINLENTKIPELKQEFQARVGQEIEQIRQGATDLTGTWSRVADSMCQCAVEVFGAAEKRPNARWFDEECKALCISARQARSRWLATNSPRELEEMRERRREVKRVLRRKKRESLIEEVQGIEEHGAAGRKRCQFQSIKNVRSGFQPRQSMVKNDMGTLLVDKEEVTDRWVSYFEGLLNRDPPDDPLVWEVNEEEDLEDEPSEDEIRDIIGKLKTNKAPGTDGIQAELIKAGGRCVAEYVTDVVREVWSNEVMPEEWKTGELIPLHKKGDRMVCGNYRGICLLSIGYKVYAMLLERRLRPYYQREVGNYQAGFRQGQSTTDQLFSIRQLLEKYWEYGRDSWHMFVDFKQAYDSVCRESLMTIMSHLGIPKKLIRLTKATNEGSRCCVRVGGSSSGSFEVRSGLRQGCPLAPTLFNIALEWVMRQTPGGSGMVLSGRVFDRLAYADDVDLMADTFEQVEEKIVNFSAAAGRVGLTINEEKTKLMKVTRGQPEPERDVACGGLQVGIVDQFKYLGSLLTSTNEMETEVLARIAAGTRCAAALKRCLRTRWLSIKTKAMIYTTFVRPVALYGSETWRMTKRMEQRLTVFENGVLRGICGPVYDPELGCWRRRHNVEVRQMTGVPMITGILSSQRMRWAGHVARREEDSILRAVVGGQPDGRRPVGRPRKRWTDSLREDLRELGEDEDWQEAALNRERWREVVAAARGLHGLTPGE